MKQTLYNNNTEILLFVTMVGNMKDFMYYIAHCSFHLQDPQPL